MTSTNQDLSKPVEGAVDSKSGQVINQQLSIAQMGRTKVKNGGPFVEQVAQTELVKHTKKSRKFAPVMFLVDRMRFTKKGFHQYLPYRDIEHFYQPPNMSDTFMLYTKNKKGRKAYETYRCASPQDVQTVKNLIFTAGADRKKILGDSENRMSRSSYSDSSSTDSSEYFVERKSSIRMSRPRSSTYLPSYQSYSPTYYRRVDAQPSSMLVYRTRTSRAPSAEPHYETYRSVRQANTYAAPRQSYTNDDVTYLRSDNVNGPQIMDNGPVYMYMSRSRPTVNRSSWSSE